MMCGASPSGGSVPITTSSQHSTVAPSSIGACRPSNKPAAVAMERVQATTTPGPASAGKRARSSERSTDTTCMRAQATARPQ